VRFRTISPLVGAGVPTFSIFHFQVSLEGLALRSEATKGWGMDHRASTLTISLDSDDVDLL
jgi:hypothetical protein